MKIKTLLVSASLVATMGISTVAFAIPNEAKGYCNGSGNCVNYIDENGDGICDNRGTYYVDENGDGICDNAGENHMTNNGKCGKNNAKNNGTRHGGGGHCKR